MKVCLWALFSALAFFWAVRLLESRSVFFPTREITSTPRDLGVPFEDIYFKASDGIKLNGWLVKCPNAAVTVLHFHGNGGNISDRLEKLAFFYSLGVNVFIIDYRGYGKSEGRPSEEGIYLDAVAAYDYLIDREDIDREKLVIYGDSLGGAAAVDLATKRKAAALIVDSSFPSAAAVSRMVYPFIPTFILKTKMNSAQKLKDISVPKFFIHSVDDEIIPIRLGRELFEAAAGPKEFLEIRGGHNTNHLDSTEMLFNAMKSFLTGLELLDRKGGSGG